MPRHRAAVALLAAVVGLSWSLAATAAMADAPQDRLHGGQGAGVAVVGHTDLGGGGLNGHVAVLGEHAYVGVGTNGGFAAQWNRTPNCGSPSDLPNTVKVVSLADPAAPSVVATIPLGDRLTFARDVDVITVEARGAANVFTGDLLAVALERCNESLSRTLPGAAEGGRIGIVLYDVTVPSQPRLLGSHPRVGVFKVDSRQVSLVQREDGQVLALEVVQADAVAVLDVTNPAAPRGLAEFVQDVSSSGFSEQPCRPFVQAQGATTNATGTRAYVAYQDAGLYVLDLEDPASPAVRSRTAYPLTEEGNSFRFVPDEAERLALVTDEDLNPATTTLTVTEGPAAEVAEAAGAPRGVFGGCESVWGDPLHTREQPSVTAEVVFVGGRPGEDGGRGCDPADYDGVDAEGRLVLVFRGCSFSTGVALAAEHGAAAYLIASSPPIFAPDSLGAGDAGATFPVVMLSDTAGSAIANALADGPVVATLADSAGTWGALRVFDLAGDPRQIATATAPHTQVLTPGDGLYHAVHAQWAGDRALVAWMSDGMRVVDLSDPAQPRPAAFYVPPAVEDPTGNYGTVPLVVDVARAADLVVITDINGGLYLLDVALRVEDCADGGWQRYGSADEAACRQLVGASTAAGARTSPPTLPRPPAVAAVAGGTDPLPTTGGGAAALAVVAVLVGLGLGRARARTRAASSGSAP